MPSTRTFSIVSLAIAAVFTATPSPVYREWVGSGFLISTPSMKTSPVAAEPMLMLMPWQTPLSVLQGVVRSISPPMMITLWPPSMSMPPTSGTLGSSTIQSLLLLRLRYWWLPVLDRFKVAHACNASPQAGGAQVSLAPGPGVGAGLGVGAGVAVGVGVGVGMGPGAATTTSCSTLPVWPSPSAIVNRTYLVPTSWKLNDIVTPLPSRELSASSVHP